MNIKAMLTALVSILAVSAAAPVAAHSITNKSLRPGFGAAATDVWLTSCGAGTEHLFAQIKDQTGDSNFVSLVVVSGTKAATTTDLSGGDANFSEGIKVFGGEATYTMLVNHTRSNGQAYSIEFHCESSNGSHTDTTTPTAPSQDN